MYFHNRGVTSVRQVAPGIQLRAGRHVMVLPPTAGRRWLHARGTPLAELPLGWPRPRTRPAAENSRPAASRSRSGSCPTSATPPTSASRSTSPAWDLPEPVIAEMLAVVDRRMADPPKGDREELDAIAGWAFKEVHA